MRTLMAALALMIAATSWASGPAKAPANAPAPITGKVLEVKDAAGYTYLRLKTASGEAWAAVEKAAVKKGATVTVQVDMVMEKFESSALKKTFDKIAFGVIEGKGGTLPPGHAKPVAVDLGNIRVDKAEGAEARTVAEVNGQKAALKDKPVLVRGKVVKFNGGIMGRNWAHLRDGSGAAADGSHDILVTTQDIVQVGDIVLARGTVRIDKDFGSGYAYPVMIEDATLRK